MVAPDELGGARPTDAVDLQRDIEETRERLGETVDMLGEKLDLRKQAARHRQALLLAAVSVLGAVAVVVLRRRSRQ